MISYRFLTPADTIWLQKIVAEFRHKDVTDEKALAVLNNQAMQIQMACEDDKVCGYTLSYRMPRMDMGSDMLAVYHCFVLPEYRRRKVASTLMQNLLDYCRDNSLHYAFLITQEDNEAANALYQKLGGQLHPENRNVYYWYFTGKPQI